MAPHLSSEEVIGYWGTPTSTVDWCEKNYEMNFYIAEMTIRYQIFNGETGLSDVLIVCLLSNTLSNLMMIIPPLWGIKEILKYKLNKVFIICHILLLTVGLGSWAFHMTLLYEMQLFDELPMVWGTCVSVYILKQVGKDSKSRNSSSLSKNLILAGFLFTFAVSFTAIYLWWPQPFFQHTSFAVLLFTSFYLQYDIVCRSKCSLCQKLLYSLVFFFFFGFFLWIIDKVACSSLTALRSELPVYLNPVTQLHGWWHFFAGYASYLQIILCIHASDDFEKSSIKKNLCFVDGFNLRPNLTKKK